jgi:hypothetical protein
MKLSPDHQRKSTGRKLCHVKCSRPIACDTQPAMYAYFSVTEMLVLPGRYSSAKNDRSISAKIADWLFSVFPPSSRLLFLARSIEDRERDAGLHDALAVSPISRKRWHGHFRIEYISKDSLLCDRISTTRHWQQNRRCGYIIEVILVPERVFRRSLLKTVERTDHWCGEVSI